jgi:hypothetical protein
MVLPAHGGYAEPQEFSRPIMLGCFLYGKDFDAMFEAFWRAPREKSATETATTLSTSRSRYLPMSASIHCTSSFVPRLRASIAIRTRPPKTSASARTSTSRSEPLVRSGKSADSVTVPPRWLQGLVKGANDPLKKIGLPSIAESLTSAPALPLQNSSAPSSRAGIIPWLAVSVHCHNLLFR